MPIKRNENILSLSKEHHLSLLFCWKIRQGLRHKTGYERIVKYAQYFRAHYLESHFIAEETILFTPLKDECVQRAIEDHKLIRSSLDKLRTIIEDNAAQSLKNLAKLVDDHVRYEERELFPHLEKMLSHEQLEQIGKQLEAQPPLQFIEDYKDEFWLKK